MSAGGLVRPGEVVSLTMEAVDESAVAYRWAFGDGATASGPTVDHVYGAPGVYHVVATAADAAGNAANQTFEITVVAPAAPPAADLTVPLTFVAAAAGGAALALWRRKKGRASPPP